MKDLLAPFPQLSLSVKRRFFTWFPPLARDDYQGGASMKAAILRQFGAPLSLEERPVPEPSREAVLVRVLGAGVCHSDLHILGDVNGLEDKYHLVKTAKGLRNSKTRPYSVAFQLGRGDDALPRTPRSPKIKHL